MFCNVYYFMYFYLSVPVELGRGINALLRDGVNLSAVPKNATSPEPDPRCGYGF